MEEPVNLQDIGYRETWKWRQPTENNIWIVRCFDVYEHLGPRCWLDSFFVSLAVGQGGW